MNKILEKKQLSENVFRMELECKDAKHGTIVMWSDFDRLKLGSDDLRSALASYLREAGSYLALVFHKFLARNQIKIRIGGHELKQMV